jgi:hypothetical protein
MLAIWLLTPHIARSVSEPVLAVWDDAIIVDAATAKVVEHRHFIYASRKLSAPVRFTAFVQLEPGFRLLCCVDVVDAVSLSRAALLDMYKADANFTARIKGLTDSAYIYSASLSPESTRNAAMTRLASGTGSSYYSAPALVGSVQVKRFDANTFDWPEYGRISFDVKTRKEGAVVYRLHTETGNAPVELWVTNVPD